MNRVDFHKLDRQQKHVLLMAVFVRNALEDFHVQHLNDEQMHELNVAVRSGLSRGVKFLEEGANSPTSEAYFELLVEQIPSYWELPEIDRAA